MVTAARAVRDRMGVHHSSVTGDWWTPPGLLARVVEVLGEIDLDPAAEDLSESHPTHNVPAKVYYLKAEDGLARSWSGKVYLNPPYGRELPPWVKKAVVEYEAGRVESLILLTPARTDTAWWGHLDAYPRCYVRGRLKFSGDPDSAPFPSAVFLMTCCEETESRFAHVFGALGRVDGFR